MPSIGSIIIRLGLDVNALRTDLRRSERLLRSQARKFTSLGSSLTSAITVPFAAAGIAGVKLANDLEVNFNKIENLVGITGNQLNEFKSGVATLSTAVGKSQKELSEALFAVTSAGLRGAEGLQVLEASAKASVIGLGDTTAIARASTAVLNAYGKENITAARAVDILTAIVREGNLEAESLAPKLGRVIGIAAQMGVSFEEVGASVATFTRLGVSAEESITGLRSVLASFLSPSEQVKKALDEFGLTTTEVRDRIANQGLTDTLIFLTDTFKGNQEALGDLIPDVQGLTAVLGTAGTQGDTYRAVLDSINNSTGILDKGFKNVSKSADLQFKRALVQLQNVGIQLGNKLIPVITDILGKISSLVSRFQNLSPAMQDSAIKFGLIAAAIGPVALAIGTLQNAMSSAIGLILTLAPRIGSAITLAFGPVGIALAGVTLAAVVIVKNFDNIKLSILNVANGLIGLYNESILFRGVVETLVAFFKTLWELGKGLFNTFKQVFSSIGTSIKALIAGEFSKIPDLFKEASVKLIEQNEETGKAIEQIWDGAFDNIAKPRELLKIDKSDVDNFFAPIETKYKEFLALFNQLLNFGGGGLGGSVTNTFTTETVTNTKGTDISKSVNDLLDNRKFTIDTSGFDLSSPLKQTKDITDKFAVLRERAEELANILNTGLAAAFAGIGLAIGDALVNAQSFGEGIAAVGLSAVAAFADILQQIGEMIIKAGIAVEAIKNALSTFSGIGAIAAGIALVAIAQFIKSSIAKKASPPALAEGGLAFGPTLAIVGDNKNAAIDPEVISPLSKLKNIIAATISNTLYNSSAKREKNQSSRNEIIERPAPLKNALSSNLDKLFRNNLPRQQNVPASNNSNTIINNTVQPVSNNNQATINPEVISPLSVLKNIIQNTVNNFLSGSSGQQSFSIPALASGALVYGRTLALVGDNNNASVDPEVVSPLSTLRSILDDRGAKNVNVIGELSATHIAITNRTGESLSRRLK